MLIGPHFLKVDSPSLERGYAGTGQQAAGTVVFEQSQIPGLEAQSDQLFQI